MVCQSAHSLRTFLVIWLLVAPSFAADPPACPLPVPATTVLPNYTYNYSSPAFQSLFQELTTTIEQFTTQNRMKYYAVSVVHGNQTIYTFGNSSTKFRLGSNTKTFTALGALMLREQGRLSLDDPLKTWLPDFSIINPYDDHEITLRELMGHAAGVPREVCNLLNIVCVGNETEILQQVAGMKLVRPPWSNEPSYSNLGFSLLGHAWEKATSPKMSWEDFVTERILKPLNMDNTGIALDGVELAPTTDPNNRVDLLWSRPTGQMYSTGEDLGKYLQFLITGQPGLISESSIREWISPATIFTDGNGGYAFPWELRMIPERKEMLVSKSGQIFSHRTHIVFDQPNQIGVAVLAVFDLGTTSSSDAFADTVMKPLRLTVQSVNKEAVAATYAAKYICGYQKSFDSPTLNYKVQVVGGSLNVYVDPNLGLLVDAKLAILNEEVPVQVNSTWSLLLKNLTQNTFWFAEAPSCAAFAGGLGSGPDLIYVNMPGSLYTGMLMFDLSKGSLEWPAVGAKCYKPGFSGSSLLHPSKFSLLAGLLLFFIVHIV